MAAESKLEWKAKTIGLKCLVNEGAAYERKHVQHKLAYLRGEAVVCACTQPLRSGCEDASAEVQHRAASLERRWKSIGTDAISDMAWRDNSAEVLKNLSCMCIFLEGRQSTVYGDDSPDRLRRALVHQKTLARLASLNSVFLPIGETVTVSLEETAALKPNSFFARATMG